MKRKTIIILFCILTVTAITLMQILPAPPVPTADLPAVTSRYETQKNSGGDVTISVTPIKLKNGFPAAFDVTFETHSVDLVFDIEKVATLTDLSGIVYTPHWDGSPPGGHHRSGVLRFTPDLTNTQSVTLTLVDIADVKTRAFTWEDSIQ